MKTTNNIEDTEEIEILDVENGKSKKKNKTMIISSVLVVLTGILVFVVTASYSFFTTKVTSKNYVVYTGSLKVDFENSNNLINLNNTYPMTNIEGLATTPYTFNIKNNGTIKAKYQVRIDVSDESNIPIENIKISYSKNNSSYSEPVLLSDIGNSLAFISNQVLNANGTDTYGLKLWLDINSSNDIQGKTFKASIIVDAIQDIEEGYEVDDSKPIIVLNRFSNGGYDTVITTGSIFTDPGVLEVKDDKDKLDKSNIVTSYKYYDGTNLSSVNSINTSNAGVYYIMYSITDSEGNTGTIERVVTVNATPITPTITLIGNNSMTINQGDTFTDPGVTVDSNNKVVTLGEVKTIAPGVYTIRYIVVDSNNNMNSVIRTVEVLPAAALSLKDMLLADNEIITTPLTESELRSVDTNDNSNKLYKQSVTHGFGGVTGTADTYFFRGDVSNNVVEFSKWNDEVYVGYYRSSSNLSKFYTTLSECQNAASYNVNCTKVHSVNDPMLWRIVRINEDGTIRLILDESLDINKHNFNDLGTSFDYSYYSNSGVAGNDSLSNAKYQVDNWYSNNITGTNATKVASGNYFCEEAKVKYKSSYTSGSVSMTEYTSYIPTLSCNTDINSKGFVNGSVGLITYDELVFAGAYPKVENKSFYLYKGKNINNSSFHTMSPAGFVNDEYIGYDNNNSNITRVALFAEGFGWHMKSIWQYSLSYSLYVSSDYSGYGPIQYASDFLRPVINLNADVTATKDTTTGHYVVD